jgi:hypothetical protein
MTTFQASIEPDVPARTRARSAEPGRSPELMGCKAFVTEIMLSAAGRAALVLPLQFHILLNFNECNANIRTR